MAAYINRTISLMAGDGPIPGPGGDARNLRDSSPLQIFVKAKKKINDIFVEIEDYVRDTVSYMHTLHQDQNIVVQDESTLVGGYITKVRGIRDVLTRDHMKVAFFGRTSNGKSTVINAMLRDKILPSGIGHTTNCFLQVEGSDNGESYLITEDSTEKQNVKSVGQLAHALCKEKLGESQLVRIFWPKDKCLLLRDDVVFVDSPGIDVSPNLDEWIDRHCLDADVFVLVANAESTLMLTEKNFFHKVSTRLSKPNIFILNNRWDASASEPEYLDQVRGQHMERTVDFLVKELKVCTQKEASERIFFVSAKEALQARLMEQKGQPAHSGALAEGFPTRYFEFQDFERKFEECISKSAVKTKFEQHCQRGKLIANEIHGVMDGVYDRAQQLRSEKNVTKKELYDKLNFTEQQLLLLTQEMKDKIHQMVEDAAFNVFEMGDSYFLPMIFFFFLMGSESCERLLQDPNMQKLIHSKEMKFDLVIYEPFFTECTYGLIHKFNAPSIQILPNTLMPLMGNPVGNPNTASYITDIMMEQEMQGFTGRLMNSFRLGTVYLFRKFVVVPKMDALIKKYYPDPTIPSVEDIESKVAFLFLHSHPFLHLPKPLTPNTIELAGLHITDTTKKLPQDLQKFFDEAPDGVIYFSLGSNIRSVDMPEKMRNAILNTFANLKQKVLWKWEDDTLPGQPPNVKLSKWVPQHDVLAHPNLKLFITHGGLMSLQESIYFGVPLIAIPVFADQRLNTLRAQKAGYAISLHLNNITEETLNWAIQEMLTEPSYRENVKEASRIFRDQPQKPIERAIFWTEYAIRHKGAPHLRSTALKLNLFEYYLVDVIIFFIVSALVFITISLMCMRKIFTCMCSKSKTSNVSSSKKKK